MTRLSPFPLFETYNPAIPLSGNRRAPGVTQPPRLMTISLGPLASAVLPTPPSNTYILGYDLITQSFPGYIVLFGARHRRFHSPTPLRLYDFNVYDSMLLRTRTCYCLTLPPLRPDPDAFNDRGAHAYGTRGALVACSRYDRSIHWSSAACFGTWMIAF